MNSDDNKSKIRQVAIASLIGATIEWYDFFLYGVVAGIVFNKLYFPTGDPLISTLLAYTTFAVGFITRPLGGIVFGHFGDKIGRKAMLVLTLMIMGGSTVAIGFIPTYEQIGIFAPLLLLLMRVLQGIGLGGEWGGAVLMVYEYAKPGERGFYASLPQIGLSIGLCLASGVVGALSYFLTDAQFMAWGWRVAFVASIVMVMVGTYIRSNIKETPDFQKLKAEQAKNAAEAKKVPLVQMWKDAKFRVLAGMGARYIDGVFFNVFGVFSISYLTTTLKISRTDALLGVMAAAMVMCIFIPYFGRLSDKLGRTKVYCIGSLVTGASVFPAFWLMQNSGGNLTQIWFAIIIPFGIFYASVYGPEAALFAELFEARYRYTGISFVYQVSGIFASGITPIIATYLQRMDNGGATYICWYVVFVGIVSALSAAWIGRDHARAAAQVQERPQARQITG